MRAIRNVAALISVTACATVALGFGDTLQGHDIGEAFHDIVATRGGKGRLGRRIARIVHSLDRSANERLGARELATAAHAARFSEKALPDEAALMAAFDAAVPAYLADLLETRDTLRAAAVSDALGKRVRRQAQRALARLEKRLPAESELSGLPASGALKRLANAAAAARGYAPHDGVTENFRITAIAAPDAAPEAAPDVDGDGTPDVTSDLSSLGLDLSGLAARWTLRPAGHSSALTLWHYNFSTNDPFVSLGLVNTLGAFIEDGDADARRHPVLRSVGAVDHGAVSYAVSAEDLHFAELPVSQIVLRGTIVSKPPTADYPETMDGSVALAVTADTVEALVRLEVDRDELEFTVDAEFVTALHAAVDYDADGDGTADSFRVVYTYTAVREALAITSDLP